MAETVYEGMFILDSNRYGQDPGAVSGRISEMIQGAGGEMLVSRLWEERRLAYPIKGHRRGTYWLTYFRLDNGQLAGVERQCQLNENILRKLFLKVDPRIVETLVAHAQAVQAPGTPEGEAEGEAKKDDAPQSETKNKQSDEATAGDAKQPEPSQTVDQGEP